MRRILKWAGLGVVIILAFLLGVAVGASSGSKQGQLAAVAPSPSAPTEPAGAPKPSVIPTNTVAPTSVPKPTQTAKPAPTKAPVYGIGDLYSMGTPDRSVGWEFTVTKTERVNPLIWSKVGNKTEAKGIWEVVYMTLRNVGKETQDLPSNYFEIHDVDGFRFKPTYTSNSYSEYLGLTTPFDKFPPGTKGNVAIAFDVNPEAKGLRLYLVASKDYISLE